jgi:hypothetical protein
MRLQICVQGRVALALLQTVHSDRCSLKLGTAPNALAAHHRPLTSLECLALDL